MINKISKTDYVKEFLLSEARHLYKQAYCEMDQNPYIRTFLEKSPIDDIYYSCKAYEKNPELYNDIVDGRVKYFIHGLQKEAFPVFDKNEQTSNLKDIFDKKSLPGKIAEIFNALDNGKNTIKKIAIGIKDNIFYTITFNKKQSALNEYKFPIKHQDGIIFRMLNASEDNRIDLFRD